MLLRFAWRNIWRNKRRSSITIAAIAIGMAGILFMIGMMNGWLVNMIDNSVKLETGSIQIHVKGYQEDPSVDKLIMDPNSIIKKISTLKELSGISPRIKAFGLVSHSDNSVGAMLVGIDPAKEKRVTNLYQNMAEGDYNSIVENNTVLIGKIMAQNLDVKVGDEIILLTQGADGSMGNDLFKVGGIFESASLEMERSFVYMGLASADQLLSTYGGINELAVNIQDVNKAKEVRNEIAKAINDNNYEVFSWDEILPGIAQMVVFFLGAIYLFYFIVFGIAAFGISNTLIMAIFERIHEIGVLRALGTNPGQIFLMTVFESVIMGMVGSIIGAALGYLISLYFIVFGMNLSFFAQIRTVIAMSPIVYFKLGPNDFILGILFVIIVTALASLYPSFKAARLKPAEAIRYV
jgi:putative ABC transport system permease protein